MLEFMVCFIKSEWVKCTFWSGRDGFPVPRFYVYIHYLSRFYVYTSNIFFHCLPLLQSLDLDILSELVLLPFYINSSFSALCTFSSFLLPSPQFSSVQSLSHVQLFATPWTTAHQASLSITNSWSSLKLTSIELVMPSSHLILCRPLLLLVFLSLRF